MPDAALTEAVPRGRAVPRPRRGTPAARSVPPPVRRPEVEALLGLAMAAIVVGETAPGPVHRLGADLFLAATGFTATALLLGHQDSPVRPSLLAAWRRWFAWLVPSLVVALGAGLAAGYALADAAEGDRLPRAAVAGLLQVANWEQIAAGADRVAGPLDHLWLTSIAEQCFVAWSLVVVAVLRFARGTGPAATLLAWIAGTAALAGAALAVTGAGGAAGGGPMATPVRGAAFALGAAVAAAGAARAARSARAGRAARRRPAGSAGLAGGLARLRPAVELGQVAGAAYLLHGVVLWSLREANPGIHPVPLVVVGGGLTWVAALFTHHGLARRFASGRARPVVAVTAAGLAAAVLVPAAWLVPGAVSGRDPGEGRDLVVVAGDTGADELARTLASDRPGAPVVRAAAAPAAGLRPAVVVLHPGGAVTRDPCGPVFRAAFPDELERTAAAWRAQDGGVRVLVTNLLPVTTGPTPVTAVRCVNEVVERYTAEHPDLGLLDLVSAVCPDERCPPGDPAALRPPPGWFEGRVGALTSG